MATRPTVNMDKTRESLAKLEITKALEDEPAVIGELALGVVEATTGVTIDENTELVNIESADAFFDFYLSNMLQYQIQVFVGYSESPNGRPMVKSPIWQTLTPTIFSQIAGSGSQMILCKLEKLVVFDGFDFGNDNILVTNKHFLIETANFERRVFTSTAPESIRTLIEIMSDMEQLETDIDAWQISTSAVLIAPFFAELPIVVAPKQPSFFGGQDREFVRAEEARNASNLEGTITEPQTSVQEANKFELAGEPEDDRGFIMAEEMGNASNFEGTAAEPQTSVQETNKFATSPSTSPSQPVVLRFVSAEAVGDASNFEGTATEPQISVQKDLNQFEVIRSGVTSSSGVVRRG